MKAFNEALEQAKAVLNNEAADQQMIDEAQKALEAAINGLKEVTNPDPGKDPGKEPGKNPEPGKDPEPGKKPEPGKDPEPGKKPAAQKPDKKSATAAALNTIGLVAAAVSSLGLAVLASRKKKD